MKVHELLTKNVGSCGPETNLAEVAHIMWCHDCGIVPIVDSMNTVVGVITDRDVCIALGTQNRRASELTARQIASGRIVCCQPQDDVKSALDLMAAEGVRRLPVVNRDRQLIGMLSISDVLLAARQSRIARSGDVTWTDAMLAMDAICRPRKSAPERVPATVGG